MCAKMLIKMLDVVKGTDLPWVEFATPFVWCESKEQKPSVKFAARYKAPGGPQGEPTAHSSRDSS